jgi:hypothetical protein
MLIFNVYKAAISFNPYEAGLARLTKCGSVFVGNWLLVKRYGCAPFFIKRYFLSGLRLIQVNDAGLARFFRMLYFLRYAVCQELIRSFTVNACQIVLPFLAAHADMKGRILPERFVHRLLDAVNTKAALH